MSRLFGTDGVRGVAGVDLTADLARSLAAAAVAEIAGSDARPLVAVGRDPRPSGGWLTDAVVEGLTGCGADVALLGVIPTPAVARAVADGVPGVAGLPAFGVVISASHNPAPDNGIKFFGRGGAKLEEVAEAAIEARLAAGVEGTKAGDVRVDLSHDRSWYVEALLATLPSRLDGMRVVVDCANGAAATVAADVYSRAGADVTMINTDLTGGHINEGCGATDPEPLRAAVIAAGADAGIAHDGDADRCMAVTATGDIIDGDAILAVLAIDLQQRQALRGNRVVATVMSNLGLHRALRERGIDLVTTPVGDRYVTQRMHADGAVLGGEQSGHVVLLEHATTGDGLLTALHLLAAATAAGRPLADLAAVMRRLPQVLVNVRIPDPADAIAAVGDVIAEAGAELGDEGRVFVRPSGTEPLARVMVEAATEAKATEVAERIAAAMAGR